MALTLALTGSAVRPWPHDSSHMATHYGNTLNSIHSTRSDVKTNESDCVQRSGKHAFHFLFYILY